MIKFRTIYHTPIIVIILFFSILQAKAQKTADTTVVLIRQKLEMIPDTIFAKIHLKKLDLGVGWVSIPINGEKPEVEDRNRIKEIPTLINQLQNLEVLDLSFNEIRFLPVEMSSLKKLKVLSLCYNENFDVNSALSILKEIKSLELLNLIGIPNIDGMRDLLRKQLPHISKLWLTMDDLRNSAERTDN